MASSFYFSPASIYLLKVNNENTRTKCETCSKLIIKTPDSVSDVVLVSLILTLNKYSHVSVFPLLTWNNHVLVRFLQLHIILIIQ